MVRPETEIIAVIVILRRRRLDLQDRRNEQLGIGMVRIVEHLIGQALFDHIALPHDHQPVGQQPHDRQIMGDDDCGNA